MNASQVQEFITGHANETYAIVDVRYPDEFRREHIEGSINLPVETVVNHAETLRSYQHIFLYCRTGNRSGQACQSLSGADLHHAVSIEGGIDEMKRAGFVIVAKKDALPLQQQVLLGAGSLVTTGMVLGAFASPWWHLLPLGVGFGLMYAGLSGNCMLARVLMMMPWNTKR